jgi:hypothetical protein
MRLRLIAIVPMALTLLAGASPATAAPPRVLHVTKECSDYTGAAGSYCTFTSSNIGVIHRGDRIYYADAAAIDGIDSDIEIVGARGIVATGHCALVFANLPGTCTFEGDIGRFGRFSGTAAVSLDGAGVWHWDGVYALSPLG